MRGRRGKSESAQDGEPCIAAAVQWRGVMNMYLPSSSFSSLGKCKISCFVRHAH